MIVKSCYVPAEVYCSLYQNQISYRDEFVFEEVVRSYHAMHIAVRYDIPNNPEHQLVPHKSNYLKKTIRNQKLHPKKKGFYAIYRAVVAPAPKCENVSEVALSDPIIQNVNVVRNIVQSANL